MPSWILAASRTLTAHDIGDNSENLVSSGADGVWYIATVLPPTAIGRLCARQLRSATHCQVADRARCARLRQVCQAREGGLRPKT